MSNVARIEGPACVVCGQPERVCAQRQRTSHHNHAFVAPPYDAESGAPIPLTVDQSLLVEVVRLLDALLVDAQERD